MLYKGKKFDIRSYMLIGSTKPFIAFFKPGYVRLSLEKYDVNVFENTQESKFIHLTNQAVQKKHPEYNDRVEETTISMEELMNYAIE